MGKKLHQKGVNKINVFCISVLTLIVRFHRVPASQHPEIAPAEFEKYVDAHGLMIRKKSVKRRQSVLSVYFTASDHQKLMEECDTAEAEKDRQAALSMLESKQHTYKESSDSEQEEEDTKKRKMMLRRSVSLHLPTTGEYPRNVPGLLVFDRNSSPLDESRALVPKGDRPLLRRGARTNFKRNSSLTAPQRNRKSESDSIDSLRRLDEDGDSNIVRSTSAERITLSDALGEETSTTNAEAVLLVEEPLPMLSPVAENEEVRELCIATREEQSLASPSPPAPVVMARSVSTSTASSNQSRKSAWSWAFWSDEKSSKKNNKIDPNATATTNTVNPSATTANAAATEDDKIADTTTTTPTATGGNSNKRFTLSSLFSRKSKSNNNQSSASYTTNFDLFLDEQKKPPKDFQLNRMHMTRLPLHVERAIYKLSHVKLANPRRPLHEQVLISNQMFWYLSVIATNAPHPASSAHDASLEEQPQRKAPRKRLVKKQKQRPVSAPQQPQQQHRQQPSSNKKRTTSHTASSNPKGNTPMFMANPRTATNESTGFVVPENYLNPKQQQQQKQQQEQIQQQQQQQQQQKKKPTLGNSNNKKVPLYHKQQQGSDSSSSDDDDDDDDDSDDDVVDHGQESIAEKIVISHSEKEDELPLAMYKSSAYNKKIK
ncbi:unnamed protein product [Mucor fragilis]